MPTICTLDGVKHFTRDYLDEVYLWYREIPLIDPAPYTNIGQYFHDLLTPALDPNGQRKDRFSFIVTSAGRRQPAVRRQHQLWRAMGTRWPGPRSAPPSSRLVHRRRPPDWRAAPSWCR